MPVTADEMISAMQTDFGGTLSRIGVTADVLARQLKAELKAKETRFIKVKRGLGGGESDGPVAPEGEGGTIKRGRPKGAPRIVFNGGGLGGDTVIAVDTIAWGVRQAARMDAQKLMGAYPASHVKVGGDPGNPIRLTGLSDDELIRIATGGGSGADQA